MLASFATYCDLQTIDPKQYHTSAVFLAEQKPASLYIHHRHGYVFWGFWHLVTKKRTLEEFFRRGDVLCKQSLFSFQQKNSSSLDILCKIRKTIQDKKKNYTHSCLIVDACASLYFEKTFPTQATEFQKRAKKNNLTILSC